MSLVASDRPFSPITPIKQIVKEQINSLTDAITPKGEEKGCNHHGEKHYQEKFNIPNSKDSHLAEHVFAFRIALPHALHNESPHPLAKQNSIHSINLQMKTIQIQFAERISLLYPFHFRFTVTGGRRPEPGVAESYSFALRLVRQ